MAVALCRSSLDGVRDECARYDKKEMRKKLVDNEALVTEKLGAIKTMSVSCMLALFKSGKKTLNFE